MNHFLILGLIIPFVAILAGCWLGWQLLQQNGRILLRLEKMERQLEEATAEGGKQKAEMEERAERFSNRSLAGSKIKRDGLKAGTIAPEFRLPRLDGGELSLSELRGKPVLLVFSSPHCGPCNTLAPKLEKFHRKHPQLAMVMISREDAEANRVKVNEHGLTFPIVLQKQWEVSRDYAYFATPVAYLIDSTGVITADVAVGVDAILDLMTRAMWMLRQDSQRGNAFQVKSWWGVYSSLRTRRG